MKNNPSSNKISIRFVDFRAYNHEPSEDNSDLGYPDTPRGVIRDFALAEKIGITDRSFANELLLFMKLYSLGFEAGSRSRLKFMRWAIRERKITHWPNGIPQE